MNLQHIRHATMRLEYAGRTLLVDPMLSPAGSMPPVPNSANDRMNPTAELNVPLPSLLELDAVLLTHTHRDHWDEAAMKLLSRAIRIYSQPEDAAVLKEQGFRDVVPVEGTHDGDGALRISRTSGRHGQGELGRRMGPVSGFVLQAPGEPTLYIAGDTVWCEEVEQAIAEYAPEVIVLFAGAAQFLTGGPITMGPEDVERVCRESPNAQMIVTHMEAWNHCLLTRKELSAFLAGRGLQDKVRIPENGEKMTFHRPSAEEV